MTQEALAQMYYVYKAISKEFFGDDNIDFSKGNPIIHLEADISAILFRADNVEEAGAKIYSIAAKVCTTAEALEEVEKMIQAGKKEAWIRLDWPAAFRGVKKGSDLSHKIKWSFFPEDLRKFIEFHKRNKFRKKIEDLLTDCNYHSFCSCLILRDYDKAREVEEL